jgi:sensor histidine kinase YesM
MISKKIIYHIFFWLFIFGFVLDYFVDLENITTSIKYSLIECLIYATVTYVNLLIIIPEFYKKEKPYIYILALFIFLVLTLIPYNLLGLEQQLMDDVSWRSKLSYTLNFTLFSLISFLYWYFEMFRKEQQNALVLENEKLNAEINLLKAQISPHFLFNSLNNIYSLSVIKSDDTPKMVANLSEILRYLIYEGQKKRVNLVSEIEMIQKYIGIHKLKKIKGAKNIEFTTNGIKSSHKIIPLLFITFVENVFKHGDIQYNEMGYLKISLNVNKDGVLYFKIDNSKKGVQKHNGIGLSNVKKQLELNYGQHYDLKINDNIDCFSVNLKLNV